ncbi:hypothetical protein PIB30_100667, partial [Stylosanthes scabra]|nr:hypothetical protein [Stylosanthes scabra]
ESTQRNQEDLPGSLGVAVAALVESSSSKSSAKYRASWRSTSYFFTLLSLNCFSSASSSTGATSHRQSSNLSSKSRTESSTSRTKSSSSNEDSFSEIASTKEER